MKKFGMGNLLDYLAQIVRGSVVDDDNLIRAAVYILPGKAIKTGYESGGVIENGYDYGNQQEKDILTRIKLFLFDRKEDNQLSFEFYGSVK